jgi:hypothetical protein
MTASNIFSLVRDKRDIRPFLPILLPELEKACGHSNPEVREKALLALGALDAQYGGANAKVRDTQTNAPPC